MRVSTTAAEEEEGEAVAVGGAEGSAAEKPVSVEASVETPQDSPAGDDVAVGPTAGGDAEAAGAEGGGGGGDGGGGGGSGVAAGNGGGDVASGGGGGGGDAGAGAGAGAEEDDDFWLMKEIEREIDDDIAAAEASAGRGGFSRYAGGGGGAAEESSSETDDDSSDDEWIDDDTPWVPYLNECLFDGFTSSSFDANVRRPRCAHGLLPACLLSMESVPFPFSFFFPLLPSSLPSPFSSLSLSLSPLPFPVTSYRLPLCPSLPISPPLQVQYMQSTYSFYVPYKDYLVDPKGFFTYLQEKVCRYNQCLYCRKAFNSLEACQNHMLDKSHCKVRG